MKFYSIRNPLILETSQLYKTLLGASNLNAAPVTAIYSGSTHEISRVHQLLSERYGIDAVHEEMRIVTDTAAAHWPHFPYRLGRLSLGLTGRGQEQNHLTDKAPLPAQLHHLRNLKPGKTHFRFAVVNGFGTNLGDNLVGTTALRQVISAIYKVLPAFSIDFIFALSCSPANRDLVKIIPEVEHVLFTGVTLDQFGFYDAYFDFSELLYCPRYDELPAVDFYLWWMGLNPDKIAVTEKRNHLSIGYDSWAAVSTLLKVTTPVRVLLCHRASVALRSIPKRVAQQMALALLQNHPELTLMIDFSLGINHPRLMDLDGQINSVEKLKALVAQVDGLITVDSFPQHVADACATPTILLSSSIPASHFPYYPHMTTLLPPGVENLAGWGRTKVNNEDWPQMAGDYAHSWSLLDVKQIWQRLSELMASKASGAVSNPAQLCFSGPALRPTWIKEEAQPEGYLQLSPRYPTQNAAQKQVIEKIAAYGDKYLKPGHLIVHAGTATGELTVRLAAQNYPGGTVCAFEPRRLYFQTLCANAILAGFERFLTYSDLPFIKNQCADVVRWDQAHHDVFSRHDPGQREEVLSKAQLSYRTIDALELVHCELIVIQPPMPLDLVLAGAIETLHRCNPIIFAGPLTMESAAEHSQILVAHDYLRWVTVMQFGQERGNDVLLALIPRKRNLLMHGFDPIDG